MGADDKSGQIPSTNPERRDIKTGKPDDWVGSLDIHEGWSLFSGRIGDTEFHSHYLTQLLISEQHEVSVDLDDRVVAGHRVFIPSGVRHRVNVSQSAIDVLYVDPILGGISRQIDEAEAEKRANELYDSIRTDADGIRSTHFEHSETTDERVLATIQYINEHLNENISIETVVKELKSSVSRLTVLMKSQTGLTFRQFIRWRRLSAAIYSLSTGSSFTDAAHCGGFSDSAHFSRTMKEMFGVTPTDGLRHLKITVADTLTQHLVINR